MKLYTQKYRIYPNKQQQEKLAGMFGCVRWVYNNALAFWKESYESDKKGLNYKGLCERLILLKKDFEWLKECDSQALQQSLKNLEKGFKGFFAKRTKYPNFKSRYDKQSLSFPQRVKLEEENLKFPKLGLIKTVLHREIKGTVKTVTLSKEPCGHYYASVLSQTDEIIPDVCTKGKTIGLDLGLKHFLTTSEGIKYTHPKVYRKLEQKLARASQNHSCKKKGSQNREKARIKLAKIHKKITNTRGDYLHKLSRKITNDRNGNVAKRSNNQVVIVEDLAVKNMVKNRKLSKSIADSGWSSFITMLDYKLAREGKILVKVGRFFPSSKTCFECGYIYKDLKLKDREWTCVECTTVHDRDVTASKNIRAEGIRLLAVGSTVSACGEDVRPTLLVSEGLLIEAGSPRTEGT